MSSSNGSIHIEIIHQGDHCAPCQYMAEAVEEILPKYGRWIQFTKVEYTKNKKHARRFYDLSVSLYGEAEVKKLRCAPIPSLFIDGEMIFDVIPQRDELLDAVESALKKCGISIP